MLICVCVKRKKNDKNCAASKIMAKQHWMIHTDKKSLIQSDQSNKAVPHLQESE